MTRTDPYLHVSTRTTPQNRPIPGTVPNSAGGHSFPVDDWTQLRRFLVLGTSGGTYYIGEQDLTVANADALMRCIAIDGVRTVREIEEISVEGRNVKQHPIMFALAACSGAPDDATRAAALEALPRICRTGSHLLLFAKYVEQFRGWGEGLQKAIARWYVAQESRSLAFQVAKYQSREGWSHRDLLRLAKPGGRKGRPGVGDDHLLASVLDWAAGHELGDGEGDSFLQAVDEVRSPGCTIDRATSLVEMFRLPWEVLPSEMLNAPKIWHAMLPDMGLTALVRNLGRLTANGTIVPMTGVENLIVARLTNEENVRRSRIHPMQVLLAATTYNSGGGFRGKLTWAPSTKILSALDSTFGMSFRNVVPAEKRTLLGLDVSGSMSQHIAGTHLSAREATAAMAMITVASEPEVYTMAFAEDFKPFAIKPGESLAGVASRMNRMSFGGTDCALPMLHAADRKIPVDTFVVLTDSETWFGKVHPVQALESYRQKMQIPARLVVVGMCANRFSIADPNDAGMLDVVGFDSAAPALMADFSAGRV